MVSAMTIMLLAVDASTLVAEVLRARGRALLIHPALVLLIAAEVWNETTYELHRRVTLMVEHGRLDVVSATRLLGDAITTITARVTFVSEEVYHAQLVQARRRIPRDPRDAPTVAPALTFHCGIWTADQEFFGCGLPVWTSETLRLYLDAQTDP